MADVDFEKLYDIFQNYPAKLAVVKEWEKSYRQAALKDNLYQHAAVKELVALLSGFIESNNTALKAQRREDYLSDNLFFDARNALLVENKCWAIIVSFFTGAQSVKEEVAAVVKEAEAINKPSE